MIQIQPNLQLDKKQIEFEQGFIFGAFEDGLIYFQQYKSAYVIEIEQKYREWLETVRKAMVNVYGDKIKPTIYQRTNGYYRLQCYSKAIYQNLKAFRKNVSMILKASKLLQVGYLKGIFDAEGSVNLNRKAIYAYSIDHQLIVLWKKLLKKLGIAHEKIYQDKNGYYQLPLYGLGNLKKFHAHIGFFTSNKDEKAW